MAGVPLGAKTGGWPLAGVAAACGTVAVHETGVNVTLPIVGLAEELLQRCLAGAEAQAAAAGAALCARCPQLQPGTNYAALLVASVPGGRRGAGKRSRVAVVRGAATQPAAGGRAPRFVTAPLAANVRQHGFDLSVQLLGNQPGSAHYQPAQPLPCAFLAFSPFCRMRPARVGGC